MSKRDIGAEMLDGIRALERGRGQRTVVTPPSDVRAIRETTELSQSAFAALLGVSVRTLQDWEQRRRKPTGAALSLLRIAERRPEILAEVASRP